MGFSERSSATRPRGRRLGGRRPRIAFVVDWLEDPYQSTVLRGAAAAATERGANLIALPGGVIGGRHKNGARRNGLYELITPEDFDALVLLTGTLGNQLGTDVVESLCHQFPKEKVCSIAIELPGSASVLVDNTAGMRAAVEHLIVVHGYRKIAFIRGPEANEEAQQRFVAYCDVLDAQGIPFDERLVCPGDFRREAGFAAMNLLFDERGLGVEDIDAVMSSDDQMVIAAGQDLERRGFRVPADIALMGFDDVAEARYCNPPLASVRQPLFEQGREAVRVVLSAINSGVKVDGGGALRAHYLDTSPQFRESCGCIPNEGAALSERPRVAGSLDLEATLIRQRELILAETTRAARGAFGVAGRGWEVKLFNALQDEARGEEHSFRRAFHKILTQVLDGGGDVSLGNAVISALRRQLHTCIGDDISRVRMIESLLHDARILTSDIVERAEAGKRLQIEGWARVMSGVSARLLSSFKISRLNTTIAEELPRIGIESCYVSRFVNSERSEVELLAAFGAWGRLEVEGPRQRYRSAELIPEEYRHSDEAANLVIEPLLFEEKYLGFVVFQSKTAEGYVFEALQELLSACLHGASLLEGELEAVSPALVS